MAQKEQYSKETKLDFFQDWWQCMGETTQTVESVVSMNPAELLLLPGSVSLDMHDLAKKSE